MTIGRALFWLMAGVISFHVAMAVLYDTTDPCQAVAVVAQREAAAQSGAASFSAPFTGRTAERRLRERGLPFCYGAMAAVWRHGGLDAAMRAQAGLRAD